jgi:hypothetical protein
LVKIDARRHRWFFHYQFDIRKQPGGRNMQKSIASGLATMGMAAGIVLSSAYVANGRSDRAERPALSSSESVARADARIADLKANLRLSAEQAKHWPGLESVLHDIAMKRAKSLAGERDVQTGHAPSESSAAAAPPIADEDGNVDARTERDARSNTPPDDIAEMRREADALTMQSANLRQIADAAKPLYDSLDDHQRRRLVQFVHEDLREDQMDDSRGRRR